MREVIASPSLPISLVLWAGLWVIFGPRSAEAADFKVYWNVPSFQCHSHGIYINASKYGIVQNTNDTFFGDKVAIFYKPGKFPYLKGNTPVNGGIPQNGSLENHKKTFRNQVDSMPKDFQGVAVLDFESYLPGFSVAPEEYRNASEKWVASRHPNWTKEEIHAEAERSFNTSALEFIEVLLQIGTEMRPKALWGYYHYPYCGNQAKVNCSSQMMELNDKTPWLYQASRALYPSIYVHDDWLDGSPGRRRMSLGRLNEAKRINTKIGKKLPILSYCWYFYHGTTRYLSPVDLVNTIGLSKMAGIDGAVVWGGAFKSKQDCIVFQDYVESSLGPLVQYILRMPNALLERALKSPKLLEEITRRDATRLNYGELEYNKKPSTSHNTK